jgi:hypothetical protein
MLEFVEKRHNVLGRVASLAREPSMTCRELLTPSEILANG